MIRSKGEAGTGNVVEAVRHLRSILGDIRKITQADRAELFEWAKRLQAPLPLVQEIHRHRQARRCRCSAPAAWPPRPTPPSPCSSAPSPCSSARASSSPTTPRLRAKAIVEATTHFNDPAILAKVSRGLGAAMPGLEISSLETTFADRGW